jgi:hypothetical protein
VINGRKCIGSILIEKGIITPLQLEKALAKQKDKYPSRKIGEVLVRTGFIARAHIEDALLIQYPELSSEDIIAAVRGQSLPTVEKPADPRQTTSVFVESPKFRSPTATIGIGSVYGLSSASRGGLINRVSLYREEGETDENLAERAGQAIKELLLKKLRDNEDERASFESLTDEKPKKMADGRSVYEYLKDFLNI